MAFPENPAGIDFARSKAADIARQDVITGQKSKAAQVDEQMQELYKARWPAGGDKAMYGVVDETFSAKARDGRFVM